MASGSDILITGSANLTPIQQAIKGLSESFNFARAAVDILSDDVAKKSGNMKQSLGIAKEAVKQFESEIRKAVSSGAIEGLSENAKKELGELKHSLEQSASDYRLFKNQVVGMTKEMSDADKRRTELAESLLKDRKQKDADELASKKRLAREIASDWKLAIAEDKDRTAAFIRNAKEIEDNDKRRGSISDQLSRDRKKRDEDELALKKRLARELSADWKLAIAEDKDRTRAFIRNAKEIEDNDRRRTALSNALTADRKKKADDEAAALKKAASEMNRLHREAIAEDNRRTREMVRNAKSIERAWGLAIAEDIRRANAAKKNSQAIIDAQKKEADSHRLTLLSLKGLLTGYLSFSAVRSFVGATVDAAVALERVRNSLIAATGSLKGGQEAFQYTRKLAYGLGLDLQALSKQYGLFSAAVKDSGFTQNQMRSIFESVAEASRVLGLSVEDMQGVFVALQQIATKGTVQMEELRQQLGDRLPGSVAIMAKALGVSQKELFALTKQGLVPAREALILFDIELRKTLVNKALPEALLGIQVKINNLRNAIFELKAAFGGGFAEGAAEAMGNLQEAAKNSEHSAKSLGEAFGFVGSKIAEWASKFVNAVQITGSSVQMFGEIVKLQTSRIVMDIAGMAASSAESIAAFYKSLGLDKMAEAAREAANSARIVQLQAEINSETYIKNAIDLAELTLEYYNARKGIGLLVTSQADLDSQTRRTMQTAKDEAESRLVVNAAFGKTVGAHEDLIKAIRKKIAAEEEAQANTLKGIKSIVVSTEATDEHKSAVDKMVESIHKEQEAIEGSQLALSSRGVILQEAIVLAERDGVVTAAAAETIKQKVGEMYDAYERLGIAVPEWLQKIGDKYGAISKAQQSFLDDLIASADKAEERLTKASDAARDSSGVRFGEMDLTDISAQIQDAQRQREEAVAELLAATDSAGMKKAQKKVDDAQKDIDDRVARYKQIREKIDQQNVADNAPDNAKNEALKKQADELRSEIAALENKQGSGSLSSEELGRLFEAKDALQNIKNEMGDVIGAQEQIHFGWSEVQAGTDAAYDAWEEYHALVQKNAIEAKLALEQQADSAHDVAASADDIKASLVKVGDQWVISNEAAKGTSIELEKINGEWDASNEAARESSVELEKINGHWKVSNASAKDMAKNVGLVAEEIKQLAVENKALDEVQPMETAAKATMSMEAAMERITSTHMPKLISQMETLRSVSGGVALGGGGGNSTTGWQSDVAGQ